MEGWSEGKKNKKVSQTEPQSDKTTLLQSSQATI